MVVFAVSRTARHPSKKALISFGKPGWQRRLENLPSGSGGLS
jgi:hypothetical protein